MMTLLPPPLLSLSTSIDVSPRPPRKWGGGGKERGGCSMKLPKKRMDLGNRKKGKKISKGMRVGRSTGAVICEQGGVTRDW